MSKSLESLRWTFAALLDTLAVGHEAERIQRAWRDVVDAERADEREACAKVADDDAAADETAAEEARTSRREEAAERFRCRSIACRGVAEGIRARGKS